MADQVLYSGVACITDLMVKEGLINLDFADVRAVMREMGKAMMGTGEASGEKRALRAAEAAISNPLIDDVSMRGAKGLLISITGGNDLTLYEVDEAATRIREEVDPDANIIVGATFDESLEGIIRVSVVATGVDQVAVAQPAADRSTRRRIAEATQRARAEAHRSAASVSCDARRRRRLSQRRAPQPVSQAAIDAQATAAVAAALAAAALSHGRSDDPPDPAEAVAVRRADRAGDAGRAGHAGGVHPAAGGAAGRPRPRMPRIDELPMPAQNQIRARERGEVPEDPLEKPRMSLLQRLASVGLGRREEGEAEPRRPRRRADAAGSSACRAQRPAPRMPASRPEPVSEFAKRPAPQGLDPHGRQTPVQ